MAIFSDMMRRGQKGRGSSEREARSREMPRATNRVVGDAAAPPPFLVDLFIGLSIICGPIIFWALWG